MVDQFFIENDHEVIHALVSDLRSASQRSLGPEECTRIFSQIIKKLEQHFWTEETLMDQYQYPEAKAHAAAHRAILKLFREGKENLVTSDGKLSLAVMERGEAIIDRHIEKYDAQLTFFLQGKKRANISEPAQRRT
jgi:hemerythrin-like metal-binding protein